MDAKMTFKRYELKYVINREQRDALLKAMEGHLALDMFGHSTIRNLYYDTDDWRLVRRSIEKPWYKEKLRVRSYGLASDTSPVFVELKKKYEKVVVLSHRRDRLPADHRRKSAVAHGQCGPARAGRGRVHHPAGGHDPGGQNPGRHPHVDGAVPERTQDLSNLIFQIRHRLSAMADGREKDGRASVCLTICFRVFLIPIM